MTIHDLTSSCQVVDTKEGDAPEWTVRLEGAVPTSNPFDWVTFQRDSKGHIVTVQNAQSNYILIHINTIVINHVHLLPVKNYDNHT